ncbi:ABC transporter permease [Ornithinimicrobium faecis]|uniref:ABC transporter permease n=1 Tax=Ornithinimicrobium faecis TaxID=2934158 RepID=UPI00211884E6|nr:ABC transporter permease [Ornithinimicrobium sp. HY1745]
MSELPFDSRGVTGSEPARHTKPTTAWTLFLRNRVAVLGLGILILLVLAVTLGPIIHGVNPFAVAGPPLEPPGESGAVLGTDALGRDVLAGLLSGGRVTLLVGVIAALLSTTIGVLLGGLGGYFGGWVDAVAVRITEFFQVLPPLLFAMVVVTLFEPSVTTITVAIGVVSWPSTMRITRAEFLRIRTLDYVKSERAAGAGAARIIMRTVLPNALPPIIVMSTLVVGLAMLFEAGLSFLGLGDPNTMSWGLVLGNNRDEMLIAWWLVALPGFAIFLAVLSVSLAGDGLNDALNPRGRER